MADTFEDEVEQTVTIKEYIENIEAEELEADLVLGGDEGKECTYNIGYMKRQAIFSCLTCVPSGNAGVCTACSLTCHDGHEVVELWTKRKFKCDCGNSKFGEFFCKLSPNKDPENVFNSYNHNFKGSYCTCGRPYPDPEAEEQIEMIQCCICEDWFHEDHLGLESPKEIPRDEEGEPLYAEFICQECSARCSFLKHYPASIWSAKQKHPIISGAGESLLENDFLGCARSEEKWKDTSTPNIENKHSNVAGASGSSCSEKGICNADNGNEDSKTENFVSNTSSSTSCVLGIDINVTPVVLEEKKPMFLSKRWRHLLCKCNSCIDFYTQKGIDFLIDKADSIEEYEEVAKQKRQEKLKKDEGAELNFLNKLDHVQKIEILSGIADMKNEFMSFLESFDSSKPITSADIQGVFENLARKKKQRLS